MSTLRFSVKHGVSVWVTARQQTFCASNLEQGGGEVPAPSVLRKELELLKKRWREGLDGGVQMSVVS